MFYLVNLFSIKFFFYAIFNSITLALLGLVIFSSIEFRSLQLKNKMMRNQGLSSVSITEHESSFSNKLQSAYALSQKRATRYAKWILEASTRQKIDPVILASLVNTESNFRYSASSSVGAIGPAQVRPIFWSEYCMSYNLKNPAENIYCGAQVLAYYLTKCEDNLECALRSYNVGYYNRFKPDMRQAGARYISKIKSSLLKIQQV